MPASLRFVAMCPHTFIGLYASRSRSLPVNHLPIFEYIAVNGIVLQLRYIVKVNAHNPIHSEVQMTQATRFDPRLAPLTHQVKDMAEPQPIYHQKAAEVRAERVNGHAGRHPRD